MKTNNSTLADSPKAAPQAKAAHTPGATRAAIAIRVALVEFAGLQREKTGIDPVAQESYPHSDIAAIIDRETAAPALLTLLQLMLRYSESCEQCGNAFYLKGEVVRADARAAIAQAEGRT